MIASEQSPQRVSRRQFLVGAGTLAGAAAVGGGAFGATRLLSGGTQPTMASHPVKATGRVRAFHSRPDLKPATMTMSSTQSVQDGYFFVGPWASGGDQPGPLMVDYQAEPVWFRPVAASPGVTSHWGTNFRPYTYRGKPVLAWWEGHVYPGGFGKGEGIIVDSAYREVARVKAVGGRAMDLHEFHITPQGTAIFTCYPVPMSADLSAVGGPRDGQVYTPIFQEVDIRTGRLLLEWRGLDHIPLTDSYLPVQEPFDYLHINSVDVAPDGNLLVSTRHTWALYKVDRKTGQVMWRLGGKRSDFDLDKAATFAWQHDARQPSKGTISLFDNGSQGKINTKSRSRGLVLSVDEAGRRVRVAQEYLHHVPVLAVAMGSVEILPNGNVIVGWGSEPFVTDFASDGSVLSEARLLSGYKSYRSFRKPWKGIPEKGPDIAAGRDANGRATVYVSWNGATDAAAFWQLHAGPAASDLRPLGLARRQGFETAIPLGHAGGYVAVTALDEDGTRMATSRTISV